MPSKITSFRLIAQGFLEDDMAHSYRYHYFNNHSVIVAHIFCRLVNTHPLENHSEHEAGNSSCCV